MSEGLENLESGGNVKLIKICLRRSFLGWASAAILLSFCSTARAQTYKVLEAFPDEFATNNVGAEPFGGLLLDNGVLYGMASVEGSNNGTGSIFSLNPDGTGFRVLKTFAHTFTTNSDGAFPSCTLATDGNVLYGTTSGGGTNGGGTVFTIHKDGSGFAVLKTFAAYTSSNSDGSLPNSGVTIESNALYGTTQFGGTNLGGVVFKIDLATSNYSAICSLFGNGYQKPGGALVISAGTIYGAAPQGGSNAYGNIYKLNTDGTGLTILKSFSGTNDGYDPYGGLLLNAWTLYGTTSTGGTNGGGTLFKINADGSDYVVLKNFGGSDGSGSTASLTIQGSTLYGTTFAGGTYGYGTVFQIHRDGTGFAVLKNFSKFAGPNGDGANPYAGVLFNAGVLYGTTVTNGGNLEGGTVFSVNLAPAISVSRSSNAATLSWPAISGANYQTEYSGDLTQTNWNNLGSIFVTTNGSLSQTDIMLTNGQRFYRVVLVP